MLWAGEITARTFNGMVHTVKREYSAAMPPKRPASTARGRDPVRGTAVPLTACICTKDTAVRALCDACKQHRKTVLNRIKHRAQRARKAKRNYTPGTITLTPEQALRTLLTLDTVKDIQVQVLDRLALSGTQPKGDTAALFRALAELRAAIQPILATADEERIELTRPRNWDEAHARLRTDLNKEHSPI